MEFQLKDCPWCGGGAVLEDEDEDTSYLFVYHKRGCVLEGVDLFPEIYGWQREAFADAWNNREGK